MDEEIQDEQLRGKIYDQVTPEDLSTAIAECKSLIRPHADDYFDFLALRYSYLRQFVPSFLAAFSFSSRSRCRKPHSGYQALFIRCHYRSRL